MDGLNDSPSHFVIVHHVFKESYGALDNDRSKILPASGPCDPEVCEEDCDGTDHRYLNQLRKKLTWPRAVLFIVGEVLGGGVVAIGNAFSNTGKFYTTNETRL